MCYCGGMISDVHKSATVVFMYWAHVDQGRCMHSHVDVVKVLPPVVARVVFGGGEFLCHIMYLVGYRSKQTGATLQLQE